MALVDELRKRFPRYAGLSDGDIVRSVSERLGEDPLAVAKELGVQINSAGFFTGLKTGLAGFPIGAGRALEDMGAEGMGRGLRQYGEDVQFRNPTTVHDFESFGNAPWQGFKEISGQAIGSTLPALIPYVGPAARALGPLGTAAAGAGVAAVPSYGGIRQTQQETGQENIPGAIGGALAVGAIEQLGGAQRLFRPGSGRMIGPFAEETVRDFGRTPLRTGLRTGLRTQAEEGLEELAQSPIEQYFGGQDPMQHLGETAFSGFAGAIGATPFGVPAGLRRGFQQSAGREYAQRTLASDAPMDQQYDALDISRQIAPETYQPLVDALAERVYQGMLEGAPVDLLAASQPLPEQLEAPWHAGLGAMPPGTPIESPESRAAGIIRAAAEVPIQAQDSQFQSDVAAATQILQQSLPPEQFNAFMQEAGLADKPQKVVAPKVVTPKQTVTRPPFAQMFRDNGGTPGHVVERALAEVQTPDQAVPIIQNWLENKKPSQKALLALEEMHKKLTGQTFAQVLQEREANATQVRGNEEQVQQRGAQGQPAVQPGAVQGGQNLQRNAKNGGAKAQQQTRQVEQPGPVTITKGEPNAQVQEMRQEAQTGQVPDVLKVALQAVDEDEKAGKQLAFMPSDWGANLPFNRNLSLHDAARKVLNLYPAMAQDVARRVTERKSHAIRPPVLQGAEQKAETKPSQPVQQVQAPPSTERPSAGSENRQEPEQVDAMEMILGELAKRDPRKALVLGLHLGKVDGTAYTDVEIAKRLGVHKTRARQMREEASAIAEGIARAHGFRPEQFREQETSNEDTGAPAQPTSSLAAKRVDAAAAGITDTQTEEGDVGRNTGYTTGPISKVNSPNITGEVVTTTSEDGQVTGYGKFIPDQEGEANTRLRALEEAQKTGSTDLEAATVWDTAAHVYTGQGEKMKAWSDVTAETKKDWREFYASTKANAQKSDRQKDAAVARRLREYLKKASYSEELLSAVAQDNKLTGLTRVWSADNKVLSRAFAYRVYNGYGPLFQERFGSVYTARGLPGDAAVVMLDDGKYYLLVEEKVWYGSMATQRAQSFDSNRELLYLRMFQHELEHVVDDSGADTGQWSSDPVLEPPRRDYFGREKSPGGAVYNEIKMASQLDQWVENMFAYPMDPAYSELLSGSKGHAAFMMELHAQIMSLYHVPNYRSRLARALPGAYYYAQRTDEKIRAELGRGIQPPSRAQEGKPEVEGAPGIRQSRTSNTKTDGNEPRVLFEPQGHEGYAAALGRLEQDLRSRDSKRIAQARQKFLNLGRTPVVMRAVEEGGAKPFRKSDVMTGTGSTIYMKGADVHQGALHGGAVPMSVLQRLPELLADPVAIFKSSKNSDDPNSYKVVIDAEVAGAPVVVAMKPNHPIKEARGEPAHFTVTIFPLKRGWPMAGEWVEAGLLRYVNDQHPSVAGQGTGPQGGKPRLDISIAKSGAKVVTKSQLEGTPPAQWSKGLDDLIAGIPEAKTAAVTNVADAWAKFKPTLLTLHQMVDQFGEKLASLNPYVASMDKMEQRQTVLMNRAHNTLTKWQGLPDQTRINLNQVMLEATTRGIHPDEDFGPGTPNEHETDQDEYQALKRKYDALPAEAKETYQAVKKLLADNWQARKEAFARAVTSAYDKLIADAVDDESKEKLTKERDKEISAHSRKVASLNGPYFPLLRFGDYLMIAESKELQAAEKATEDARGAEHTELKKKVERLKKDKAHYVVQAFETRYKAEQAATLQGARGLQTRTQLAEEHLRRLQPVSAGAVDRISDRLTGEFDRPTAEKLKSLITQLYISTLPEHAALQRQLRRQGIEGATSDMLRAVAETVEKDSFYLSRMEFADELTHNLFQMRKESKGDIDLGHVYRDLTRRAALDFEHKSTPIQNFLARMSGVWHLGMSPAYLLTNSTQPWMITAPVLAGKFGMAKSLNALRSAWVDAARIIIQSKANGGFADINFNAVADPGEQAVLKAIQDRGQIDITQNVDLGLIAEGTNPKLLKFWKSFNWANHHIEASNRIVTGLASYRLARAQGMSQQAAQDYAFKQVVDTQLNYTDANAAYWMKRGAVPLGKLIFQFRKYQQGMLYLLARNAQLAFKGDRDAMRALAYLAATQVAMAGAVGLPLTTAGLAAGGMFASPDDEEGDVETRIRNYLADAMGPDAARALWKGLPTLLGADLSKRLGMGDLWKPLPFLRLTGKTGQENMAQLVTGALGAPFGMLGRLWDGAKLMEAGDWQKGAERMLPKMISDLVKAERYAEKGISTRAGTVTMRPDKLDGWDIALRAAGFSPTVESEHYEAQQSKEDVSRAIQERRNRLLANYANARLNGGDVNALLDAIANWNDKHPDRGVRIDRSSMLQAVQVRRKGAKEIDEAGVRFRKNEKPLRGIDRYASGS